eukprot:6304808-Amphidinium_carterae.1
MHGSPGSASTLAVSKRSLSLTRDFAVQQSCAANKGIPKLVIEAVTKDTAEPRSHCCTALRLSMKPGTVFRNE